MPSEQPQAQVQLINLDHMWLTVPTSLVFTNKVSYPAEVLSYSRFIKNSLTHNLYAQKVTTTKNCNAIIISLLIYALSNYHKVYNYRPLPFPRHTHSPSSTQGTTLVKHSLSHLIRIATTIPWIPNNNAEPHSPPSPNSLPRNVNPINIKSSEAKQSSGYRTHGSAA